MPNELEQAETAALRSCHECGHELRSRDRYCRRCGVRQPDQTVALEIATLVTGRLAPGFAAKSAPVYRSFSSSLVNAITAGVTTSATARMDNPVAKNLVFALISLPIWLLIVLLSPLDAWAATRAAANQLQPISQ